MSDISPELTSIAKLPEAEIRAALVAFIAKQQKVEKRRADQRKYTQNWRAKAHGDAHSEHANGEHGNAQCEQVLAHGEQGNEVYIYNTIPSNSVLVVEESKKVVSKKKRVIPRAREAEFQIEFDGTIWPMYPNKVSKKTSFRSYCTAREKASLQTIADGLQRYISTKPEYQDWSHLATWLNKERWEDLHHVNGTSADYTMGTSKSSERNKLAALGRGAARVFEEGIQSRSETTLPFALQSTPYTRAAG